jgi:hypothetical protein
VTDSSIWPATSGPGASSPDSPVTLGTEFYLTSPRWLVGLRFWRADLSITGSVTGRVWRATDPTSGTAVSGTDAAFTLSGTGWQRADVAVPVPLLANVKYKASCHFPSGYSATAAYWASGGGASDIVNGALVAPTKSNSVGGDTQGCYGYGASISYPLNGSGSGACYWVDVVVTDVDPGAGQTVVLGQAVEASSAGAVTPARAALLGQALEADAGHVVAAARSVLLGHALQVDAATGLTVARAVPVAQASGTDTAHTVRPGRAVRMGQALEFDSAHPIGVPSSVLVPGVLTASAAVTGRLSATSSVSGLEARS